MRYKLKLYTGEDADLETVMKRLAKRLASAEEEAEGGSAAPRGDPYSAGEPLTGQYRGYWKLRIGDWRLIYEIDEGRKEVYIVTLCHRGNCY